LAAAELNVMSIKQDQRERLVTDNESATQTNFLSLPDSNDGACEGIPEVSVNGPPA